MDYLIYHRCYKTHQFQGIAKAVLFLVVRKRDGAASLNPAYLFFSTALWVIAVLPFEIRTFTTLIHPAWLTDLEAFTDTRLILSPPFAGMKQSYGQGGDMGKCL